MRKRGSAVRDRDPPKRDFVPKKFRKTENDPPEA